MSSPNRYSVPLADLESVKVPLDEQVEEQVADDEPEHDEAAGHLPGNVRPYGA